MTVPTPAEPKLRRWLTPWQFRLFALPLAGITWLVLRLLLQKPDDARLFWTDPLGLKMLGAVVGLVLAGSAIYVGACRILNRNTNRLGSTTFLVAQSVLVTVWWFGFGLPAGFVLTVGPSAIRIQKNLVRMEPRTVGSTWGASGSEER